MLLRLPSEFETVGSESSVWLISDLHLDVDQPQASAALFYLVGQVRGVASTRYILGDLFDARGGALRFAGQTLPLRAVHA